MNKTAIYVRVSTAEQAKEGYSIQEQIDRLTKYCDAMSWTDYKVYTDPGYSGASLERPGLKSMLKDIQCDRISRVLVYKLDRLSRSQKDTLNLIEDRFLSNDVDFISLSENFDTATPFGRAMVGILAVFAQLEREQIKERMTMGKEARAKEGKWNGGRVPIGYQYVDGEFVIDDFEAMQIREAFDLCVNGGSINGIANIFNSKGYRTKHGKWTPIAVRRILDSQLYIGKIRWRDTWLDSSHEAIISKDTYDEAQRLLRIRSEEHQKYKRRKGLTNSYLGGYIYCGHCGAKYCKHTAHKVKPSGKTYDYGYYTCYSRLKKSKSLIRDPNCKNKNWREDKLDELVFDEIRKLRLEPLTDRMESVNDSSDIIRAEIEKINIKIDKLMDLYLSDSIDKSMLESKIHELDAQRQKLEDDLYAEATPTLTQEELDELVFGFDEVLESGNYDDIRLVIGELIEKIVIDNEDVSIYWKF